MGGIFGIVSKENCILDLFHGTDYHAHMGTASAGLSVANSGGLRFEIHRISNRQFRDAFEGSLNELHGSMGLGVISDYEPQPLNFRTHLGNYGIATVSRINNLDALVAKAMQKGAHFQQMGKGGINPTDLTASLVSEGSSFEDGILNVQDSVQGACTMALLTDSGLIAARDKLGRTPLVIGRRESDGSYAIASETCSFANPNMGFSEAYFLGPGEAVLVTPEGFETIIPARDEMQVCSFLWVYYGNPASSYEGINVQLMKLLNGASMGLADSVAIDRVGAIPDSAIDHGIGYANARGIDFERPYIKFGETYGRSFMQQEQEGRQQVADMKILPVRAIIKGKRWAILEDSIVRATQLRNNVQEMYDCGAVEVHMRPSCPPLIHSCEYLNFSRSRSVMDLAARRAVRQIEGNRDDIDLQPYADPRTPQYRQMVEVIREELGFTSLAYQTLDRMIGAIGLPKKKLCTHCWDGSSHF